jgi:hypothetical protein
MNSLTRRDAAINKIQVNKAKKKNCRQSYAVARQTQGQPKFRAKVQTLSQD